MILAPINIIKAGMVAYHLKGNKIDDSMRMTGDCGGYKDKQVAQLMRDGWTFVCSNNQFKKGGKITKKDAGSIALALKQCNEISRPKEIVIYVKQNNAQPSTVSAKSELDALETAKVLTLVLGDTLKNINKAPVPKIK